MVTPVLGRQQMVLLRPQSGAAPEQRDTWFGGRRVHMRRGTQVVL